MQAPAAPSVPTSGEPRLAILVSGRGSNMRAIVEAARAERWPARFVMVLAHRDNIPAVASARALGLPVRILPLNGALDRSAQDRELGDCLQAEAIDWVVLAGYMRILSAGFVRRYAGRLVNIHPSLLPAFPGLHTHRRAIEAGCKVAGATVAPGAGGSGRLQSLVATGHVQIQFFQAGAGGTTNVVYASGDKAEYGAADEVLILTGNPRIETGSGTMVGTEALIYDLKSRSMRNRGPYRIELRSDVLRNSVLFNRGTNAPKSR
jgi:formyltetrahydrofolate-dependent phosphoribosylglycinamide formyltransferase